MRLESHPFRGSGAFLAAHFFQLGGQLAQPGGSGPQPGREAGVLAFQAGYLLLEQLLLLGELQVALGGLLELGVQLALVLAQVAEGGIHLAGLVPQRGQFLQGLEALLGQFVGVAPLLLVGGQQLRLLLDLPFRQPRQLDALGFEALDFLGVLDLLVGEVAHAPARRLVLPVQPAHRLGQVEDSVLGPVQLVLQADHLGIGAGHHLAQAGQLLLLAQDEQLSFFELGFPGCDLGLQALRPVGSFPVLLGELRVLAFQVLVGILVVGELQGDIGLAQLAPFLGLLGLALEHVHVLLHELEVVLHARKVLGCALELAQGLLALLLVFADARGLLEHDAALLGLVREDAVDHLGLDEAVGGGTHPRIVEQVMDVLEAAGLVVDEVFGLPVPERPAGDHDLGVFAGKHAFIVVDEQAHLGHVQGLALRGAGEDDVLHLAGPQGLGALLAQHPADGIDDIGLAAAVGTHHRGDAFAREIDLHLVGEGLEAENPQLA